jgi:hypothetical protein
MLIELFVKHFMFSKVRHYSTTTNEVTKLTPKRWIRSHE